MACVLQGVSGGCLGAGTGAGSCPSAPFRLISLHIIYRLIFILYTPLDSSNANTVKFLLFFFLGGGGGLL